MTIQQAYELAVQHHQSGRLAEAEVIYRQILALAPHHAGALHLLGVIAHQMGRNDVAMDLIRQAIALAPGVSDFHSNLGAILREKGKLDEAIAAYREAIALKPTYAEAHNSLGNAPADIRANWTRRLPPAVGPLALEAHLSRSSLQPRRSPCKTRGNWTKPSPLTVRSSPSSRPTPKLMATWETLC